MRRQLYKILAATLGLAITFTLSCSDDKDEGGGWKTCKEVKDLRDRCMAEADGVYDECINRGDSWSRCEEEEQKKFDECAPIAHICKPGVSEDQCADHYEEECPELFDNR